MTSARDQIIEKTCELLELQGYHATGLNQIIRESGSPKGSLYHYFPGGKEELAVEAVTHVGALVNQRIRNNLAQTDDAAEAIRSFIQTIAFSVEQSEYRAGGPITTIAMETASKSSRLRETCAQIYEEWQAAFAEKLQASGIAAPRSDRIAALIIASIEGGVILCRTSQTPKPLQQVAEEIYLIVRAAL